MGYFYITLFIVRLQPVLLYVQREHPLKDTISILSGNDALGIYL
jgi:hypothetical protein